MHALWYLYFPSRAMLIQCSMFSGSPQNWKVSMSSCFATTWTKMLNPSSEGGGWLELSSDKTRAWPLTQFYVFCYFITINIIIFSPLLHTILKISITYGTDTIFAFRVAGKAKGWESLFLGIRRRLFFLETSDLSTSGYFVNIVKTFLSTFIYFCLLHGRPRYTSFLFLFLVYPFF